MKILLTGGAGYIGSHTLLQLLQSGHDVTVFDNLSNSSEVAIDRVRFLSGRPVPFIKGDIRDEAALEAAFDDGQFDAVIHFAGLKAVGESVAQPLRYYDNNVNGTLKLVSAMERAGVRRLVFSSSATVYGLPESVPLVESAKRSATNPYGRTKLMAERILEDVCSADSSWAVVNLRYFNPVGAHPSGMIGEDPAGTPNNLMPFITQVACGRRARLSIFGGDYPTVDGTGVRDYIHVQDLARGHLAALDFLLGSGINGVWPVNLGTGQGVSVLQMVDAFQRVAGIALPYEIVGRRAGDVAECYAAPQFAEEILGWRSELSLVDMCRDAWRWQVKNPRGYAG